MKASELILELQKLIEEHGDLEAIYEDEMLGTQEVEGAEWATRFMGAEGHIKVPVFWLW